MPAKDMHIVFMGTPEFAVESLQSLLEAKKNIVGVITAPDKPSGRGKKIQFSPVKQFAEKHHIHLILSSFHLIIHIKGNYNLNIHIDQLRCQIQVSFKV